MAYATQADLVPGRIASRTLAQLTSEDNPPAIDISIVTDKLDEASGVVEMYCRDRYTLPLQPTKELIGITCALAIFLLYSRKPGQVPEAVATGYDNAMRLLRDVSTGKAGLDQPIGTTDQTGSGNVIRSRREQTFSNTKLRGFS